MSDYFDELVERIKSLTELDARSASRIADVLMNEHGDKPITAAQIVQAATDQGHAVKPPANPDAAPANAEILPEISTNPLEVLAEMYRVMPRTLAHEFPRVGRAPKSSVFYSEEIQAAIAALPEHMRVLIADVDLTNEQVTVTLYDAANDLDRRIGPISLDRFDSVEALKSAIETLVGRLPLILRADSN
jgi:hypothetical protein